MLWKRQLEQIANILPEISPSPWRVFCDPFGDKIDILDVTDNVVLAIPVDLDNMEERGRIWKILDLFCLFRNNSELWFEEMKKAKISDIVLPKKKENLPIHKRKRK